jgi:hypothetical protein
MALAEQTYGIEPLGERYDRARVACPPVGMYKGQIRQSVLEQPWTLQVAVYHGLRAWLVVVVLVGQELKLKGHASSTHVP